MFFCFFFLIYTLDFLGFLLFITHFHFIIKVLLFSPSISRFSLSLLSLACWFFSLLCICSFHTLTIFICLLTWISDTCNGVGFACDSKINWISCSLPYSHVCVVSLHAPLKIINIVQALKFRSSFISRVWLNSQLSNFDPTFTTSHKRQTNEEPINIFETLIIIDQYKPSWPSSCKLYNNHCPLHQWSYILVFFILNVCLICRLNFIRLIFKHFKVRNKKFKLYAF